MGSYVTLKEFREFLVAERPPSARWMTRALPSLESLLADLDQRGWANEGRRLLFSVFSDHEVHRVGVWLTGLRVAAGDEQTAHALLLARVRSTRGKDTPAVTSPRAAAGAVRPGLDSMTCDLTWTQAPRPPVPSLP